MRSLFTLIFLLVLLGGCVPEIPVKPEFGVSAQRPTGNIPPEFAAFNNYQPGVDALLADQICATPYVQEVEKTAPAAPGQIVSATGRCEPYTPFFDSSRPQALR
jgi:hypothetical protein